MQIKIPNLSKKKLIGISIFIVLLIAIIYSVNKPTDQESKIVKVEAGRISKNIIITGRVDSTDTTYANFEAVGKINNIFVNEGDMVNKGQILATLNTSDILARLKGLEASKKSAEARVNQTLETYMDETTYGPQHYILKQDRLGVIEKESAIMETASALSKATLYAPISGMVVAINRNVGELSNEGNQSAFIITNPDKLMFETLIDEEDLSQIKVGQSAELTLNSYSDQKFPAKLEYISKFVMNNETNDPVIKVRFAVDWKQLSPQLFLEGDINLETDFKEVKQLIPTESIFSEENEFYVWKLDSKNRIAKQKIKKGYENDEFAEVLEGLQTNDLIVSSNIDLMSEGVTIREKK